MKEQLLRQVQNAMLEIAKDVKNVCDENGINYFLDSGTLIGAIRHNGFIPWDDDLDIGMLREDYERFLKIAPECLGPKYFVQSIYSDDQYSLPFAKIRKIGTKYVEAVSENSHSHKELFIDILPYDNYPSNIKQQRKMKKSIKQTLFLLMMKSGMKPWLHHQNMIKKNLAAVKYYPYIILGKLYSRNQLVSKLTQEMTKYNNDNRLEIVVEQFGANVGRYLIPKYCFNELIEKDFEGIMFKIPKDYHTVLTRIYGDYMKLPPIDERENRHQIKEVQL